MRLLQSEVQDQMKLFKDGVDITEQFHGHYGDEITVDGVETLLSAISFIDSNPNL